MAVRNFAKSGRLTALAIAMAALALSGTAQARPDDEGRADRGSQHSDSGHRGGGQPAPAWTPRPAPQGDTGGQARWSGGQPGGGRPDGGQTRGWGGSRSGGGQSDGGQSRGWGGSRSGGGTPPPPPPVATQVPPSAPQPGNRWGGNRGGWSNGSGQGDSNHRSSGWNNGSGQGNSNHRSGGWQGDRGARNGDHDRRDSDRWRDNDRRGSNDQWRGQQHRGNDYRAANNWPRSSYRNNRNDHNRWNRDWRHDRRYDWNSYRRYNPSIYRWGAYYAPYRGYSYRRMSIGFFLDSLFFSSSYWINDPWQYRLPEVYGPYRWVRYYDDALLVNIYSGEVVDVINNFFW